MILKKKKAVIAAILSAALTASAVMPTVSAGTRTKEEAYGDSTYAQRFLSLYDDVITNGEENGYLSNWYMSEFCIDEIHFTSMEQYMMYKKAMLFHDMKIASKILQTSDVAQIKQLGRAVSGYDENYWNGVRQIVVYQGLMAKFSQNEKLKDLLLSTGDSILAECAVKDRIWGIGLSMKDADRLDKAKWKGQNLLGYALMLVRERL